MAIVAALFGGILGLIAGAFLNRISMNGQHDRERCAAVIASIDAMVTAFHERFLNPSATLTISDTIFNYQLKGLVGDATLLPIIGRESFEGEYNDILGEIFKLSLDSPLNVSPGEKETLINSMDAHAIKLKGIINSSRNRWRLGLAG